MFVQEGIYDEFEKKLVEKAKAWVVGDPFDPKVQQGPQVSKSKYFYNSTMTYIESSYMCLLTIVFELQVDKKQFDKILSYIEHGKREGATLLTGGKVVGNQGYYVEPTVFTNVKVNFNLTRASKWVSSAGHNEITYSYRCFVLYFPFRRTCL